MEQRGPERFQGRTKEAHPPKNTDLEQKEFQRVLLCLFRIGYNPINHAYEQSNRGEVLKGYDESKEVNRYVRSKNII